jgi:putative phage-type endonuclease
MINSLNYNDILIINDTYNDLKIYYNDIITKEEYSSFKLLFIDIIYINYPHLQYIIPFLDNILNCKYCLEDINISINKFNNKFITCEERDDYYHNNRNNINFNILTEKQKKLINQYEYLINLPQPVQKSPEWFLLRNDMITASSCGAAIGESHYNPIKEILLDKIGLGKEFKENDNVYHGKKYEKIAIMIYEIIYNTKIGEFGLIKHPNIPYLGASPDGISMSLTLDGKINKLLGRMLEIKCPVTRKINSCGKIKGDICPSYYYIQVMIQLECCDLDECDFWQCNMSEYKTKEDFDSDDVLNNIHSENQVYIQDINTIIPNKPKQIKLNPLIRKGAIIELLPKDSSIIPDGEKAIWYAKYIYPPTILMNPNEYSIWIDNTLKNIDSLYPDYKEYSYSRTVYWKLELSHNELIIRQKDWFQNNKHLFEIFWNRVLYYRNNLNEARDDIVKQKLSNQFLLSNKNNKISKQILKEKDKKKDIFLSDSD